MTEMNLNENLDELKTQHEVLDQRLVRLARPRSLSPEAHYEMQVIKKRKLVLKDRINRMEQHN